MVDSKAKKSKPAVKQPRMKVPEDLTAAYANIVRIAHTPSELMFDFARLLPGDPNAEIVSRVLMSPLGAKLFLRALNDNLAKYETAFGEIAIPKKQSLADFLFKPPQAGDEPPDASQEK